MGVLSDGSFLRTPRGRFIGGSECTVPVCFVRLHLSSCKSLQEGRRREGERRFFERREEEGGIRMAPFCITSDFFISHSFSSFHSSAAYSNILFPSKVPE